MELKEKNWPVTPESNARIPNAGMFMTSEDEVSL